jgi:hypothetical protein
LLSRDTKTRTPSGSPTTIPAETTGPALVWCDGNNDISVITIPPPAAPTLPKNYLTRYNLTWVGDMFVVLPKSRHLRQIDDLLNCEKFWDSCLARACANVVVGWKRD